MSRTVGSGALSVEAQLDVFRALSERKASSIEALARKHNVTTGVIKGVWSRLRSRPGVVLESPVGETHVTEEPGQQAVREG